jgi:hypothetical protein
MDKRIINKSMKTYTTGLLLMMFLAATFTGCNKQDESPFTGGDNYISSFELKKDGVTLKAAISPNTIVITAPEHLLLSGATVEFTISENAVIDPDPASVTDWDAEHTFTVTAHNGATNSYTYRLERNVISAADDVTLLTQADVEAFAALKVGQINGTLTVGAATGEDTVRSLAPLSGLKIATGGVVINLTYAGNDLAGLENLEKTGLLHILSKKVKTVSFPKLTAVRLDLNIDQATAVETLDFPELTGVDKDLRIYYADSLRSIHFPKLKNTIGMVTIQGRSGTGANKLQTVEFPALKKAGGNITLTYWREATTVNFPLLMSAGVISITNLPKAVSVAMPQLETAAGLSVQSCDLLTGLDFRALKTVTVSSLSIQYVAALTSVEFPELTAVSTLAFYIPPANTVFTSLRFPKLETANTLTVPNVASLTEVYFPLLKTVTGDFRVESTTLTNLNDFPALETVGGQLFLYNASALTSTTLPSLKKVGTYRAYGLTSLTTLDVRGITEIGSLELTGSTMNGLTLIGDDVFPGTLYIGSVVSGVIGFPVTIQGFKTVGNLTVSSSYLTAFAMPQLERVTGLVNFSSGSTIATIDLPNLASAGGIGINYYNALTTLNLPKLATVTGYTDAAGAAKGDFTYTVSSNIASVTLPELTSVVGNVSFTGLTAARPLATLSLPKLASLTGTLTITGTNNATFTDLSGFGALTSAGGITISNFTQLKNFAPLKNVIPALSADTWKVTGCGYNPTYQNMVDGNYSQP